MLLKILNTLRSCAPLVQNREEKDNLGNATVAFKHMTKALMKKLCNSQDNQLLIFSSRLINLIYCRNLTQLLQL